MGNGEAHCGCHRISAGSLLSSTGSVSVSVSPKRWAAAAMLTTKNLP